MAKLILLNFVTFRAFVILFFYVFGYACSTVPSKPEPELNTVSFVDLDQYLGQWYEIARYPHSFEKGCYGARAFYEKLENGNLKVVNQCQMQSPTGDLNEAIGEAEVVDSATNAKLKVQFFWPFKGDYWIIDLDKDYEYAIVSEPNRQYLWVLSRTPYMNEGTLEKLKVKIKGMGFDLSYLMRTP